MSSSGTEKSELSKLQKEKDHLLKVLKEEFGEVAEWIKDKGFDVTALGKYAKSFAAVAMLSLSLSVIPITKQNQVYSSEEKEMHYIKVSSDQLTKLNPDEFRALKVWNAYANEINLASAKYNVEPEAIFATIMVESNGNPNAIRYEPHLNDSSYGLGQILYGTAVHIGYEGDAKDLFEPATNIDLIGRYYRWNIDAFGNLDTKRAAIAYNAGNPNNIPTYGYTEKFNKWYDLINKLEKM